MFGKRNFAAYFIAHFSGGLLIAVIVAFTILHDDRSIAPHLSNWEEIWRTVTEVLPQWLIVIVFGSCFVTVMSLGAHKFLANLRQWFRAYRTVNGFSIVLGLGMLVLPIQFFLSGPIASSISLILGLVAFELLLIHLVEWLGNRSHPQAEKRNSETENNSRMGRNILLVNFVVAIPLTALLMLQTGLPHFTPFDMQITAMMITLNMLLLWALQSAFFMVLHGCQKSCQELIQGLKLVAGVITLSIILSFGLAYYWYWILTFMTILILSSMAIVKLQVRRGYFGLEKAKREPLAAF